jgi:hypothetical protein
MVQFLIIGAFLSFAFLPCLSLAAQPANTYAVRLIAGGKGAWNPAPAEGNFYFVPNNTSQTFTFTASDTGAVVPGLVVDDPAKTDPGYFTYAATPNNPATNSQAYTVHYTPGGKADTGHQCRG